MMIYRRSLQRFVFYRNAQSKVASKSPERLVWPNTGESPLAQQHHRHRGPLQHPAAAAAVCRTQERTEGGPWPWHGTRRGPAAAAGWSRAAFTQQWLWVWHRRRRLLGASAWSGRTSSRSAGRHHDTGRGLGAQPLLAPVYFIFSVDSESAGCSFLATERRNGTRAKCSNCGQVCFHLQCHHTRF